MPESVTCREFIDCLDAYLDGTLVPTRRAVLEEHLAACTHCRAYLNEYRATVALARSLGKPAESVVNHTQAPPTVLEAVHRAIAKK